MEMTPKPACGDTCKAWSSWMDATGHLLVPLEALQLSGFIAEEFVAIILDPGGLIVKPLSAVVRDFQKRFSANVPLGVSLADELIKERRREADDDDDE